MAHAFFNSAAVGLVSEEAQSAAGDHSADWNEDMEGARSRFGALFQRPPEYITLFHNTTAAAQRVLSRVERALNFKRAMLLTTDLEYPGIVAMIDDSWRGPVAMVELARLASKGCPGELEFTLKQAVLLTRPSVVYISHIVRSLGCSLLTESILSFIKEIDPRTLIIVDGAQALGNVSLDPRLLDLCDFYLTSGHKWLCGAPTLGVANSHPRWQIADPAQAYSRPVGSGGTGNVDVLRSSVASLGAFGCSSDAAAANYATRVAAHNRTLATLFCQLLRAENLPFSPFLMAGAEMPHLHPSGIVVAEMAADTTNAALDVSGNVQQIQQIAAQGKVMVTQLKSERWVPCMQSGATEPRMLLRRASKTLEPQQVNFFFDAVHAPLPSQALFRFSFHHYHSSEDVRNLVAHLRQGGAAS